MLTVNKLKTPITRPLSRTSSNSSAESAFIKVVVRCRGKSSSESNEEVCVTTNSQVGTSVKVELNNKKPPKFYEFDQVLGPQIGQEQTYNLIMNPIIEEILAGFNCTVFAYGQTGTGKTYTMQGNVGIHNECINPDAGLIPRTLDHLLRTLAELGIEYAIKISMIELYNEEVTDLLSPSESKPLHLFQDPIKGLVIPKLEEFHVTSVDQAMKKLQVGINKRHVAATKINEHSSRSHCIFSITAHLKELTLDGEEVLKIGKLNLVDLAGSENIGKSGVHENIRLREVSNINTSLFTLGRVINGLVMNAPHIPYRESKLTRLLQDSLGGHTKTCIVATVSPCQSNLDVTLGTLEYVQKAMRICNRPQINKVLSKKRLIQDYTQEISSLKNQLQLIAEKDGIYLSFEDYQKLINQQQTDKEQIDALKANQLSIESELNSLKEVYQTTNCTLNRTKKELDSTQDELKLLREKYSDTLKELEATKFALGQQTRLNQALTQNETSLFNTSTSLLSHLEASSATIESTNVQLSQGHQRAHSNDELIAQFQTKLTNSASSMSDQIEGMARYNQIFNQQVKNLVSQFHKSHCDQAAEFKDALNNRVDSWNQSSHGLKKLQDDQSLSSGEFAQDTMSHLEYIQLNQIEFSNKLTSLLDRFFRRLDDTLIQLSQSTLHSDQVNQTQLQLIVDHFNQLKQQQSFKLRHFYSNLEKNYQLQIYQLQVQNGELSEKLKSFKNQQLTWRQQLISQITSQIDDAFDAQGQAFEDTVNTCYNAHQVHRDVIENVHIGNTRQIGAFSRASELHSAQFNRNIRETESNIGHSIGLTRQMIQDYEPDVQQSECELKSSVQNQVDEFGTQIREVNQCIVDYQSKQKEFSVEFESKIETQNAQCKELNESVQCYSNQVNESIQQLGKNMDKRLTGMGKLINPSVQSFRDELIQLRHMGSKCQAEYAVANEVALGPMPQVGEVFIQRVDRDLILNREC